MKTCKVCNESKPLSEFHKNAKARDGHVNRCKVCVVTKQRIYDEVNRERINNRMRGYYYENKEVVLEKKHLFYQENKERILDAAAKRRVLKAGGRVIESECPENLITLLKWFYGDACMHPDCSETVNLDLDHIWPVSKGGWHGWSNWQLLCRSHNLSKGNKIIDYRVNADHSNMVMDCE